MPVTTIDRHTALLVIDLQQGIRTIRPPIRSRPWSGMRPGWSPRSAATGCRSCWSPPTGGHQAAPNRLEVRCSFRPAGPT